MSKTILLVEDEAILALTERRALLNEGFKVLHVLSGEKAIDVVKTSAGQIDLILMDIDLGPGRMDGTQAAREILKEHDIPLLFLSSHSEPETVNKTEQITSYGYVLKGSENTVLVASIKMAFKLYSANKDLKAKEKALRESQARLKRAEFVAKAGNWALHLDMGIMTASEGAASIYGLKVTEIQLTEAQKITLPEYRPALNKALEDLVKLGKPYDVEFKIKKADTGEIIDIHSIAEYDKERNIVFGIIQDITQSKQTEATLRLSENKYRYLFEHNPLPMWIYDAKTLSILEVNEAAIRHYGYSRNEFLKMTIKSIRPAEDVDKILKFIPALASEFNKSGIWRHVKKDGEIIFVEIMSHAVDYEGRDARLVLLNDITENKLSEEELKENQSLLRAIIEGTPDVIYVKDTKGKYQLCNTSLANVVDMMTQEILGKDDRSLFSPDEARAIMDSDWEIIRSRKTRTFEEKVTLPNGKHHSYLSTKGPVIDSAGNVRGVFGIARDITERKQTEMALQRSESEYRSLFERANDAIVIFEPLSEIILDANNKACQIYGYSKDELLGLSLKKFSRNVRLGEEQILKVLENGTYEEFETEQFRKDGSSVFFLINASVIEYNGRKAILSINRDITERKHADETVKLLSHSVKSVTQGINITDLNNKILFVNQAFVKAYGYTEEEVIGQHINIVRADQNIDYKLIQKATLEGGWQGELLNRKKDGTVFPIFLTTSVVYDEKAKPLALVGVMTDISERKQAEKKMQENNRNLQFLNTVAVQLAELPSDANLAGFLLKEIRELTGAVFVAYSEFDQQRSVLVTRQVESDQFLLKAAMKIAGKAILNTVSPVSTELYKEMITKTVGQVNTFTEASFGAIPEAIDKMIRRVTGIQYLYGIAYVVAGELFGTSLLGFKDSQSLPSIDLLKSFAHLAAVSLRRKQVEEEIRQMNNTLKDMNAAKDKLFSIIAHDLRGPFSGFIGLTQALAGEADKLSKEEISTIGSAMNTTANKIFELLNNLLEWARLQTGRMEFKAEELNLFAEAENIRNLFSSAASVKSISLFNEVDYGVTVCSDKNMVSAVLRNLVSNAVKFTPAGGKISICTARKEKLIEVKVIDTGIGMTEEIIRRVFRIDSGYTTRGTNNEEGSGLGLVLCKELIEKNGGTIKVNSNLGKGTEFVFTLPVQG